jgi:branched-chain amino acid aminotransferase
MPNLPDYVQANTRGRLHDAREGSISPLDRGFLYGDAVYEVWRTYDGVLFGMEEHWERMEASATGLGMQLPLGVDELLGEIRRTIAAARAVTGWTGEHYVRLQVTRGAGMIGLDPALAGPVGFWVLLVKPLADLTESELNTGMRAGMARLVRRNDPRTMPPELKTGNYLNNLLALREALAAGAQEVVMVNLEGRITEGSVRNFWFADEHGAYTPPLADGLLAGVTRKVLFTEVGPAAGLRLEERALRPEEIGRYRECFATSTTQDVAPVAEIGEQRFELGPGTFTRRLKTAFREHVTRYNAEHPQFRVG